MDCNCNLPRDLFTTEFGSMNCTIFSDFLGFFLFGLEMFRCTHQHIPLKEHQKKVDITLDRKNQYSPIL